MVIMEWDLLKLRVLCSNFFLLLRNVSFQSLLKDCPTIKRIFADTLAKYQFVFYHVCTILVIITREQLLQQFTANRLLNTTIMPRTLYILHTFNTLGSCHLNSQVIQQKNIIYSGQLVCKVVLIERSF